jgi:hypothetical protein
VSNAEPWNDASLSEKQITLFQALTPLQARVCKNLERGMSPRDAYYAAGGGASTHRNADSAVSELLTNSNVQAFRRSLAGRDVNHMVMSREEMRTKLTAIARASLSDLAAVKRRLVGYDDDGIPQYINYVELEDFTEAPLHSVQAVNEISQKEHGITIKMQSGLQAMKQLAELEGLEAAKVTEIKGVGGQTVILNGVSAPEAANVYQELMR